MNKENQSQFNIEFGQPKPISVLQNQLEAAEKSSGLSLVPLELKDHVFTQKESFFKKNYPERWDLYVSSLRKMRKDEKLVKDFENFSKPIIEKLEKRHQEERKLKEEKEVLLEASGLVEYTMECLETKDEFNWMVVRKVKKYAQGQLPKHQMQDIIDLFSKRYDQRDNDSTLNDIDDLVCNLVLCENKDVLTVIANQMGEFLQDDFDTGLKYYL